MVQSQQSVAPPKMMVERSGNPDKHKIVVVVDRHTDRQGENNTLHPPPGRGNKCLR